MSHADLQKWAVISVLKKEQALCTYWNLPKKFIGQLASDPNFNCRSSPLGPRRAHPAGDIGQHLLRSPLAILQGEPVGAVHIVQQNL